VATGRVVIVTDAVVVNVVHPPGVTLYVTVYVPDVDVEGVIAPVLALIVNPAGDAVYVPPVVPVSVTD
jgi:hypothetical protein